MLTILTATIIFSIQYDSLRIIGQLPVRRALLDSVVAERLPLSANSDSIEALISDILSLLRDNGFPFAELKPAGTFYKDGSFGLQIEVEAGPPAIIVGVVAEGKWRRYSHQISEIVALNGTLFNGKRLREGERALHDLYGLRIDSLWFSLTDSGAVLHLKLERSLDEFVSGTAGYDKDIGLVGRLRTSLNSSLGGVQELTFAWFRENAQSQSLKVDYANPWLIGTFTGVSAGVDYTARPDFVAFKSRFLITRQVRGLRFGVGGGIQRGTISRKFAILEAWHGKSHAKIEFSDDGYLRASSKIVHEAHLPMGLSSRTAFGGFYLNDRTGGSADRFRFGGPPDFIGVLPDGLIFYQGYWASEIVRKGWLFWFISCGRFDRSTVLRTGLGISAKGFSLSIAVPLNLVTVDFRASIR